MKEKLKTFIITEGQDLYFAGMFILSFALFKKYEPINLIGWICFALILLGAAAIWYSYIYSIIHVCNNKDLSKPKRTKNLILILIFSAFYTPIYYTKYVIKSKEIYGILDCIFYALTFIMAIGFFIASSF